MQKSVKISKGESNTVLEPMGQSTANPNYGLPSGVSHWSDPAPRGKRYDYFTGALPWPQKGPAVDLPLGQTANIGLDNASISLPVGSSVSNDAWILPSVVYPSIGSNTWIKSGSSNQSAVSRSSFADVPVNGVKGWSVDLSSATSITINSLRQAFMLQRYYETDARGSYRDWETDRKSTRLNSSHITRSRMPSSA